MKPLLLLLLAGIFVIPVLGQLQTTHTMTKEDYQFMLKESAKKKKTAIIMVCAGSATLLTGVILMIDGSGINDPDYYYTDEIKNEAEAYTGLALSMVGIGVGIGSIPMFTKSHRLRREASLHLGPGAIKMPVANGRLVRILQPQFTIAISL